MRLSAKVLVALAVAALTGLAHQAEAAAVGDQLQCSNGSWSPTNPPTSYTYQFFQDGGAAPGSVSGNTYTVASGDAGHSITCKTTGINTGGSAQSAASNAIAVPGGAITLGVKNVNAAGAAGGATSASVTLTGVTAGQLVTGEYWYCQNSGCSGGSGPLTPTSIASSTGGTCTYISAAGLWETAGGTTWGIGAFKCTGVPAGNPSLTVTCPSDCSYLTIHVQSWNNASDVGTCTATNGTTTTGSTWTITSAAASVVGTVPIAQTQPISATAAGTTTTNGTLLTDANGRIASYLPAQATTGPFTMNGNVSPNSAFAANIICARP